jgi:hypothetical protein
LVRLPLYQKSTTQILDEARIFEFGSNPANDLSQSKQNNPAIALSQSKQNNPTIDLS